MEFADTGAHCAFSECSQQDFLPFTCDACNKQFCLMHRSYAAHTCSTSASKDVTSVNCPICQKTVKFVSNQDPNEAWSRHYASDCTQQASQGPTIQYCAVQRCRERLGPSNRYTCPKCRSLVCLSHRNSEDHDCVFGKREAQAKAAQDRASAKSKPTAARPASKQFVCPICSKSFSSEPLINHHMKDVHSESSYTCPICQLRFESPDAVSAHVDRDHGNEASSQGRNQGEEKSSSSCSLS